MRVLNKSDDLDILTDQFVSKNLEQKKIILNSSKKINADNEDISAFYQVLKAIEEYKLFHEYSENKYIFSCIS